MDKDQKRFLSLLADYHGISAGLKVLLFVAAAVPNLSFVKHWSVVSIQLFIERYVCCLHQGMAGMVGKWRPGGLQALHGRPWLFGLQRDCSTNNGSRSYYHWRYITPTLQSFPDSQ